MNRIDVNRRRLMMSGMCVAGLAATGCVSEQEPGGTDYLQQAHDLLKANPAIDIHAHPGRTFGRDAENLSPALKVMSAGGFSVMPYSCGASPTGECTVAVKRCQ